MSDIITGHEYSQGGTLGRIEFQKKVEAALNKSFDPDGWANIYRGF